MNNKQISKYIQNEELITLINFLKDNIINKLNIIDKKINKEIYTFNYSKDVPLVLVENKHIKKISGVLNIVCSYNKNDYHYWLELFANLRLTENKLMKTGIKYIIMNSDGDKLFFKFFAENLKTIDFIDAQFEICNGDINENW